MARRGVMTALQAALAGIGGAATGYVQQEERKRKQLEEKRQREREEARDLILYGREAITPGPLATRAPAGLPTPEMPAEAPPSAIPMPTGPVDFGGAMRQLAQEEAVPSGTEAIKIGDRTLYIPVGQRYRDIKRSEALQAVTEQAQTERDITQRFKTEDTLKEERKSFNVLKKAGRVKGEFDPEYGRYVADEEQYRAERKAVAARTTGTSRGDAIAAFIDKQIADEVTRMAREGKPGVTPYSPRTPYTQKDLTDAAKNMRSALTEAFKEESAQKADQSKAGTDTTATGSPEKPRPPISADTGIASPEAFQRLMGGADTTVAPVTPSVTAPAPTPAPTPAAPTPTRPKLNPARQRTADTLVRRREQLRDALKEVEASNLFGSSLDKLSIKSELAMIERDLSNFGM